MLFHRFILQFRPQNYISIILRMNYYELLSFREKKIAKKKTFAIDEKGISR